MKGPVAYLHSRSFVNTVVVLGLLVMAYAAAPLVERPVQARFSGCGSTGKCCAVQVNCTSEKATPYCTIFPHCDTGECISICKASC